MFKQILVLLLFLCSLFLCQVKEAAAGLHSELVGGILLSAANTSRRKMVLQEFVLIPHESSHFNLPACYRVGFSGAVSDGVLFFRSAVC